MRAEWLAAVAVAATATLSSPAAPRTFTFICFFDEGSIELSARCQRTAMDFAQGWLPAHRGESGPLTGLGTFVELAGHADAAEQAAGKDVSLSKRRAEAVAAFIRLNDVPGGLVKVTWYGAHRILVPDKGAKLENRRVELLAR